MRLDDIPEVLAIDQLSFSMPWPKKAYQYELTENPSSLLWVAQAHSVVGMIVVWLIVDEAHIATIAVHPDWRRQGIGKYLLNAGLRGAVARGMKSATLEVRKSNTSAQALYQSFGFEIVGVRPHYYKDNQEDACIMTLHSLNFETLNRVENLVRQSEYQTFSHPQSRTNETGGSV
jgi:ribosomal-protein-alanine N-acetyltransferase